MIKQHRNKSYTHISVNDVTNDLTVRDTTQVTVERLFPSLRIIRLDLSNLMKEDLHEAIPFFVVMAFPSCQRAEDVEPDQIRTLI